MSPTEERQATRRGIFTRLYHGETNLDIVGRTRLWLTISAVVILVGLLSLVVRGLNFGIDFEGGVVWEVPAGGASVTDARDAMADIGLDSATIQTVSSDSGTRIRVSSEGDISDQALEREVTAALVELTGATTDEVSFIKVGSTWGSEISRKALRALLIFLVAITIYISLRFEFKMAVPTLAALIHDILVTIGVYSVFGFEVTPATVIAVLTILGYSIYDGIVVFDKVDENTRLVSVSGRMTYSDMVNLSLNQTLMRSLNTSITALLPITSLLVVGSLILGATTLQEFALALLIGLASGAYSSIFIASPLLAVLKEREPRFRDLRRRLESREDRRAVAPTAAPGPDDADATDAAPEVVRAGVAAPLTSTAIPPRPRKKGRRR